MELKEHYKDRDFCLAELRESRRIFSSKGLFTIEAAENISEGLALMYLYCPDDLQSAVLAFIRGVEMRSAYIKEE